MTNDNQIHQIQIAEVEGSFLLYNVYRLTMIFDWFEFWIDFKSIPQFIRDMSQSLVYFLQQIYSFFFQEIASVI